MLKINLLENEGDLPGNPFCQFSFPRLELLTEVLVLRKRGRKRSGGVLRKRRCASGGEENERAGKDEAGLEVRWGMRLNYREHPRFLQPLKGLA